MATSHLGISRALFQRIFHADDNVPLASCSWAATVKELCEHLNLEVSDRKFISRQALQNILPPDQIARLLHCAPRRDRGNLLDHVSIHGLKILAVHLLDADHQRISSFLQHPFDLSDEALFAVFAEAGDTLLEWQRPVTAKDACIDWILRLHWQIPPTLEQNVVLKYPKDFIAPFYDRREIGKGSYGTVWSVRVGGGHIRDCEDVGRSCVIRNNLQLILY